MRSNMTQVLAVLMLSLALAWQAPAPALAQDACGTFAVATAPQPVGHPLSDNVITLTTADGALSSGTFEEPRTVEPSPKPGVALVRSLGGVYGLMDTVSGTITAVQIPEGEQARLSPTDPIITNAPSSGFILLAAGPISVWLVDLATGDAVDLTTLNQSGERFVDTAAISPNGDWLITFHGDAGLLISLTKATDPTSIDSDPLVPFPSFDDAGYVIYAVDIGGSTTIRSLDPETSARVDIATVPGIPALARTNGNPILLVEGDTLSVLSPEETMPRTLFTWSNGPSTVLVSVDGTQLLVSDQTDDGARWYLIDVISGASHQFDGLTQGAPFVGSARIDSVLFAPIPPIGPGTPGTPYYAIDLTSGQLNTPLQQDSDQVYLVELAGDTAGRYTIVNAVDPGTGRLWLVDSSTGTATQVASSPGNAAARVSPDGCHLAVAVYNTVGEGRTSTVTVTSLIDGSAVTTVPDALLLGWADVVATGMRTDG